MQVNQHHFPLNILLADDDPDDCSFFNNALQEIPLATKLETVHNGEQLMTYLNNSSTGHGETDILFLDLSMPRKTGFECISEIKENKELKHIPVIMFSTAFTRGIDFEQNMINTLHKMGAHDYIRKPAEFTELKHVIHKALILATEIISRNEKEKKD